MSDTASTWPGAQAELESEFEEEFETEYEAEDEAEDFDFGGIANALGGLLGEGETTAESEFEDEFESEGEFEGENFSFGGLFKKIAPVLKSVAKVAAPLVGSAILGPAGGALGNLAASALGESEFEEEGEYEEEGEFEGEAEAEQEIANHPLTENEALAEMMAEAAAHAAGEGEAEAMAGAAVVTVLSPRDRRALRKFLPSLIRGTAVLTRILRKRRSTRHAVRAVPTIMRRTIRKVKRQAAAGKPVTRRSIARATAREVRRVLSRPKLTRASLVRNVRASRAVKRSRRTARSHRAIAG